MRPLTRLLSMVGVGVLCCVGTSACAGPQKAEMSVSSAVGHSLESISAHVRNSSELLIQDASPRVGSAAAFSEASGYDLWVVVAACASAAELDAAKTVEVAVIPATEYTSTVRTEVRAGAFDDAVTCDHLSFR